MIETELHKKALDFLKHHFKIKLSIDCREFDMQPHLLTKKLQCFQNLSFDNKEKIVLVHMDTDYYDSCVKYGTIPINVVRTFKNLNISLQALLFVTNHIGLSKEFDCLLKDQHPNDRPMIVETLLSGLLLPEPSDDLPEIKFDQIERAGICMMNQARSHRIAFYNFVLDNDLLDKIAVSQHFNA